MNLKFKPRYKICYQTNDDVFGSLSVQKFKNKKKWLFLNNKNKSKKNFTVYLNNFYRDGLHNRQKLKKFYGKLKEYQFIKFYRLAQHIQKTKNKNNFIPVFLRILENRLDIALYRLRFTTNIFRSRQLIVEGRFLVNNKRVYSPNIVLNSGDIITVDFDYFGSVQNLIKGQLKLKSFQNYMVSLSNFELDFNNVTAIVLANNLKNLPVYPSSVNFGLLEMTYK
jgi:ribosomal protein S4